MSENASGHDADRDIADELGALAQAAGSQSSSPNPSEAAHQAGRRDDEQDYITAEVDDEAVEDESAGDVAAAAASFQSQMASAPRPSPVRRVGGKHSEFKAVAAPILLTVGVMLLIPAFWAVLVLAGAGVPMSEREDAVTMAKVMLLCWPLAISLLLPALIIFGQLHARKKNLARSR